jgi:hypothetical protein
MLEIYREAVQLMGSRVALKLNRISFEIALLNSILEVIMQIDGKI